MVRIKKELSRLQICPEGRAIAYQKQMMEAVNWLLPHEWNHQQLVYYAGGGLRIEEWAESRPDPEEIWRLVQAYWNMQSDIEQHLLDAEKVLWDPAWVCWDPVSQKLQAAYIPFDGYSAVPVSFMKRLANLLWRQSIGQEWQKEDAVLAVFRLQVAVKKYGEQRTKWQVWLEQEIRKAEELKQKVQALDILSETDPAPVKKSWRRILREHFPIGFQ